MKKKEQAGNGRSGGRRKPEVVALVCAQRVEPGFRPHRVEAGMHLAHLQVSLLPCSSKLEAGNLLAMLGRGADGVIVLGCPAGSCRFQTGSSRAARRLAYAQGILEEIGLGGWRLRLDLEGGRGEEDVLALAAGFAEELAGRPANPVQKIRQA